MKLLLFDIDGTLIRSHGAGREALTAALAAVFGTAGPIAEYHMSGKTDPRIITDLMTAVGIPAQQIKEKLTAVYEHMSEFGRAIFPAKEMVPCPGAPELLRRLNQREDVLLGLVTGNIQATAPLKLATAGIDPGLFRVGAYGSDGMDRNQLPPIAMQRAKELTGRAFTGNNTAIIGDTPADILCARAGKATAIAVASGWHAEETLARYRPDHLLPNLMETTAVVDILMNSHS